MQKIPGKGLEKFPTDGGRNFDGHCKPTPAIQNPKRKAAWLRGTKFFLSANLNLPKGSKFTGHQLANGSIKGKTPSSGMVGAHRESRDRFANPSFSESPTNTRPSIENGVYKKSHFDIEPEETSEDLEDSQKSKNEEWNPNADQTDPHGKKLEGNKPNQMLMINPRLRNLMSFHEVGLKPKLRKNFMIVSTTSPSQRKIQQMSGQIKRKRDLRSDGKRSNSFLVLLEKKVPKISIDNMSQAEIDNRIYKKVGVLTIEDEMKFIQFETQLSPAWKNKQYFF